MLGLAILLACGLALSWAAAVAYIAWTLTHPPRRTYASAMARARPGDPSELPAPRPWRAWTFRTRHLDLPAWDITGDDPDGPTIILTHGWADSRIGGLVRIPALAPLASRLVLWDLPGHGEAPGLCRLGTAGVQDLLALIALLAPADPDAPPRPPLVLYGWSLGAGVSIAAAAQDQRISAVIAEAPYRLPQTPARRVMTARGLPWRTNLPPAFWLLGAAFGVGPRWAGFDRAAWAARLGVPLLVLHGAEDEICPIDDGRRIAAAAPDGALAEIPGAGHNDLWTRPDLADAATQAIAQFLARVAPANARPRELAARPGRAP